MRMQCRVRLGLWLLLAVVGSGEGCHCCARMLLHAGPNSCHPVCVAAGSSHVPLCCACCRWTCCCVPARLAPPVAAATTVLFPHSRRFHHVERMALCPHVLLPACPLLQVDYVARYLRGWRLQWPLLPGLQGIEEVHELHPEPFGGLQVRGAVAQLISRESLSQTAQCEAWVLQCSYCSGGTAQ